MDDYNMYKCYAIHYEHKNSKLNVVTEKQSLGKKRKTEKHQRIEPLEKNKKQYGKTNS